MKRSFGNMRLGGRYRLQDRIAFGGMGEVWRALDEVLGRKVAVKILRPELAYDDNFRRRFRAEARTAGALSHPGIAAVYDYGEGPVVPADSDVRGGPTTPGRGALTDDDVAYLVMELVPGEPLSTMLSRGALGVDATLDIVAQSARALHAAHERGVVHRDVKPANLLVTPDGTLKVTDFGIARPRDHEPLTMTGQVMGTAHYLAPELARGREATPLSDVYALGVVMYECLAGRRPFEGDNQVAVATAHLAEPPPPLPDTLPQDVRELVDLAMEKDPDNRTQSAAEFAHECELVLRRRRRPQRPASEAAARTESIRREIDLRDAGQRAAGLAAGTAVAGSAAAAAAAAGTEHLPTGTPDGLQQATPPDGPAGYDQGAGYPGADGYGYPGANGSNGYPAAGYAGNGYPGNGYNGAGYGGNGYDANGYGYPAAQGEQTVSYGSDGYPRPAAGLAGDGYGNGPATPATPSLGLSRTGGSHRGRDRRVLPFALTPAMIALIVLIAAVVIGLVVMAAILFGGGKPPSGIVPSTTPSATPTVTGPASPTPSADVTTSTGPTKTPRKTNSSTRPPTRSATTTASPTTTKPPSATATSTRPTTKTTTPTTPPTSPTTSPTNTGTATSSPPPVGPVVDPLGLPGPDGGATP